jgi:hypothetical protein
VADEMLAPEEEDDEKMDHINRIVPMVQPLSKILLMTAVAATATAITTAATAGAAAAAFVQK